MAEQRCRWGILGTAQIANKNWQAIRLSGNGIVTAVASRSLERAEEYAGARQFECPFDTPPAAVGSYEELLARDDVDAVYIPLPTGLRKEWVIRAARAGKHVLCEKPCAVSAEDLQEMLAVCREQSVQFMDGVMFMHSRRLDAIREVLDDGGSIGEIRRITTQFSFCAPEEFLTGNIRMSSELEPQGCLGDLGWYTIRFALWTMNWQMPREVRGRELASQGRSDSPSPVPMEFSGDLQFDGVSTGFYVSFRTEHQEWAHVSGSQGYLHVKDFVLPFYGSELGFEVSNNVSTVSGCDLNIEEHTRRIAVPEYSNSFHNAQETNMFRTFSRLVLEGRTDPHWGEIALKTQRVLDACLKSARNGGEPVTLD
jgi:predicted dehydrogenase